MSVKQVFNTSAELDYPTVLPTLDLDFANSKTLDPRITFTRSSGGSYVGADGLIKYAGVNEARFDHDPVTGESLGLLVEESRSNLVTYSQSWVTSPWQTYNGGGFSVSNNVATSPSGTFDASQINSVFTTGGDSVYQDVSVSGTGTYTLSVFVKGGTSNDITLAAFFIGNSTQGFAWGFNPLTNKILGLGGGSNHTVVPYPNGWYRIYFTVTGTNALNNTLRFQVYANTTGITYLWGAQLEAGSLPTSYIPTVASTRTRAADNASITGKNFSEWYRQDEGTFFVKSPTASGLVLWSTQRVLDVYGPRFQLGTAGDFAMVNDANVAPFQMGLSPSYPKRIASAYKIGNYAQSNEGRLVTSTANTICTGQAVLQIGELVNNYLNGTIARLTYFPKRLPNAQLQALTR